MSSCRLNDGTIVPVTAAQHLSKDVEELALKSHPFQTWVDNISRSIDKSGGKMELKSILLQDVDMFGPRVGFVKIKADCYMNDQRLPGICFLRGMGVAVLFGMRCTCTNKVYTVLVEQPRIPVAESDFLEIPAGMLDGDGSFSGVAAREIEEECGIKIKDSDLIDLTGLAYNEDADGNKPTNPFPGVCPSSGGCDEYLRLFYYPCDVTKDQLDSMQGRLTGEREHGELITVRVVPLKDVWRLTCDVKALSALQLLGELQALGKIPLLLPGQDAGNKRLDPAHQKTKHEPVLHTFDGQKVPQLAFGLYKVSPSECEAVISAAIEAGYRHFDSASFYGNEEAIGKALKEACRRFSVKREDLFLSSKVWNDAQKAGRGAVRKSLERTLTDLDCGGYLDMYLVHWPVPGYHVDTYKELELLCKEGKTRSLGLSNYSPDDYEELLQAGVKVPPVLNQMEVSPIMYRRDIIKYFQARGILVSGSKSLHRASSFDRGPIAAVAQKYDVSPAQLMLRWSLQKGLVVVSKTSKPARMKENRSLFRFEIAEEDVALLDGITTEEEIEERAKLEVTRKLAA